MAHVVPVEEERRTEAMSPNVQRVERFPAAGPVADPSVFDAIERHRNFAMWSPLILAAILFILYVVGGPQIRHVLDFFAPGHLAG